MLLLTRKILLSLLSQNIAHHTRDKLARQTPTYPCKKTCVTHHIVYKQHTKKKPKVSNAISQNIFLLRATTKCSHIHRNCVLVKANKTHPPNNPPNRTAPPPPPRPRLQLFVSSSSLYSLYPQQHITRPQHDPFHCVNKKSKIKAQQPEFHILRVCCPCCCLLCCVFTDGVLVNLLAWFVTKINLSSAPTTSSTQTTPPSEPF